MSGDFTISAFATGALQQFQIRRALVSWADRVGPAMRDELKTQAPVGSYLDEGTSGRRSGRLRDSITYRRESLADGLRIVWSAHTPYTPFVIHGTGEHDEHAVAARRLRFRGKDGGIAYRDSVHHPGARANDFPARAFEHQSAHIRTQLVNAVVTRSA